MPRLLDLFCGAGGAAVGYARAGFEVVGVDIKPQPHYPFEFIQANAMEYPLEGFDLIHASPPCQAYTPANLGKITGHPMLIEQLRERLQGHRYVIENVEGAPLRNTIRLCGTMFDLLVIRHRLFENNVGLSMNMRCNHWGTVAEGDFASVHWGRTPGQRRGKDAAGNRLRDKYAAPGPSWSVAMGIDWMTTSELVEAIPPAYTEYIGRQVLGL